MNTLEAIQKKVHDGEPLDLDEQATLLHAYYQLEIALDEAAARLEEARALGLRISAEKEDAIAAMLKAEARCSRMAEEIKRLRREVSSKDRRRAVLEKAAKALVDACHEQLSHGSEAPVDTDTVHDAVTALEGLLP